MMDLAGNAITGQIWMGLLMAILTWAPVEILRTQSVENVGDREALAFDEVDEAAENGLLHGIANMD